MASTTTNMTGINGSKTDFAFTFPYIKTTDLKVDLIHSTHGKTTLDSTKFTYPNATTISLSSGSATNWQETSGAPKTGVTGTIWRDTGSTNLAATFYPGSAIRSSDLNDNFEQNLYVTQEAENDANDALTNSRELVSGSYVSAISTANTAKTAADAAKMATDRLVATTSDGGSSWTLTGGNTNASSDPKGVKYAVEEAEDAVSTAGTANTNANNAVNTANAALPKSGGTMSGAIAMGTNKITGLGDPGADQDAATRKYVTDNFYTKDQADTAFFNVSTSDTIKDNETFPDNDSTIATTAAINDRIIALVDEVGGFVPLVDETDFPDYNPDINSAAGTIVSIGTIVKSGGWTPAGGTVTIPASSLDNLSNDLTITGCGSTVLAEGYGVLVETKALSDTAYRAAPSYTFHRLTPKATEVEAVAGKATEIGRLGTADAVADMALLGTTACVEDMSILGTSAIVTDLSILGTTAVVNDLDALADIAGDIEKCGDTITDISACAGNLLHSEDLGSIDTTSDPLTTGTTSAISTVAANIAQETSFHDQYKSGSSDPHSAPKTGKLWYDTNNTILKYNNGTSWNNISDGGIENLVEDTTPELGGNLDCNDKNLTEVATVSGDNLQIDFGTIA